jgi:hypothetical protein
MEENNIDIAELLSIPSSYAELRLGLKLHPKQKEIVDSFFDPNKQTRICCCLANSCGKTAIIATVVTLYSLEILNAEVVYTSATWKQILTQFLPSLKAFTSLYPTWDFLHNGININGIPRLICISTERESNFQGHHSKDGQPLIMITDESAGLPMPVWNAVDRCVPNSVVVLGSPLGPDNFFYEIEHNENVYRLYNHFRMTQLDCPWVKQEHIDMMISKWGRDHPLVLSSVFAEFSKNAIDQILSLDDLNRCLKSPPIFIPGKKQAFVDVAAGGDENVLAFANGNKVELIKCWHNDDTMSACGEIIVELNKLRKTYSDFTPSCVYIDADGLGIGMCDRIKELGWDINEFHGGSSPNDKENYSNIIAEIWMEGCKLIKSQQIILPDDSELRGQLLSRKQKLNSSGKLQLESKKDMVDRSPDRADAVLCAIGKMSKGILNYVKPINVYKNNKVGQYC